MKKYFSIVLVIFVVVMIVLSFVITRYECRNILSDVRVREFNFSFLFVEKRPILNAPPGHTWAEYKNKKLGFVIAYPSDMAHPIEVNEPPNPNGFTGADIVWFQDDAKQPANLMFMWINKTKATDAFSWFSLMYGPNGKGYKIATTTTMGGVSAVRVDEAIQSIAYNAYNLNFVHGGNVWSFNVQDWRFSSEEIDYMRKSFRFLNWRERI